MTDHPTSDREGPARELHDFCLRCRTTTLHHLSKIGHRTIARCMRCFAGRDMTPKRTR